MQTYATFLHAHDVSALLDLHLSLWGVFGHHCMDSLMISFPWDSRSHHRNDDKVFPVLAILVKKINAVGIFNHCYYLQQ